MTINTTQRSAGPSCAERAMAILRQDNPDLVCASHPFPWSAGRSYTLMRQRLDSCRRMLAGGSAMPRIQFAALYGCTDKIGQWNPRPVSTLGTHAIAAAEHLVFRTCTVVECTNVYQVLAQLVAAPQTVAKTLQDLVVDACLYELDNTDPKAVLYPSLHAYLDRFTDTDLRPVADIRATVQADTADSSNPGDAALHAIADILGFQLRIREAYRCSNTTKYQHVEVGPTVPTPERARRTVHLAVRLAAPQGPSTAGALPKRVWGLLVPKQGPFGELLTAPWAAVSDVCEAGEPDADALPPTAVLRAVHSQLPDLQFTDGRTAHGEGASYDIVPVVGMTGAWEVTRREGQGWQLKAASEHVLLVNYDSVTDEAVVDTGLPSPTVQTARQAAAAAAPANEPVFTTFAHNGPKPVQLAAKPAPAVFYVSASPTASFDFSSLPSSPAASLPSLPASNAGSPVPSDDEDDAQSPAATPPPAAATAPPAATAQPAIARAPFYAAAVNANEVATVGVSVAARNQQLPAAAVSRRGGLTAGARRPALPSAAGKRAGAVVRTGGVNKPKAVPVRNVGPVHPAGTVGVDNHVETSPPTSPAGPRDPRRGLVPCPGVAAGARGLYETNTSGPYHYDINNNAHTNNVRTAHVHHSLSHTAQHTSSTHTDLGARNRPEYRSRSEALKRQWSEASLSDWLRHEPEKPAVARFKVARGDAVVCVQAVARTGEERCSAGATPPGPLTNVNAPTKPHVQFWPNPCAQQPHVSHILGSWPW